MTTSNSSRVPTPARASSHPQRHAARWASPFASHRGLMLDSSVRSALGALWANRLRSLLTILGVIVGVAAVIAVVTLTQGTSAVLNARVAGLGTNVLTITPGSSTTGGARGGAGSIQSLTQADADALAAVPHVANVSPVISANAQVIAGAQNWNTRVQGVYPSFQAIGNWQMAEGAWFSAGDESNASRSPCSARRWCRTCSPPVAPIRWARR